MCCPKCSGFVMERYGEWACLNCACRPFEVIQRVKCASVDCRALPTIKGFCQTCFDRYQRSNLTDAERSKAYREKNRLKQQKRRHRKKEATCPPFSTIIDNHCGSLPEATCSGATSAEPGDPINQGA